MLFRSFCFLLFPSHDRRAYKREKIVNGEVYYRFCISGDLDLIPTRVLKKKAKKGLQIKNVLRTGFKLEKLGIDNYYGFEIDGNRRFLLGDCTVTHNTVIFANFANREREQGRKTLILVHRQELFNNTHELLLRLFNINPVLIRANQRVSYTDNDYVFIGTIS